MKPKKTPKAKKEIKKTKTSSAKNAKTSKSAKPTINKATKPAVGRKSPAKTPVVANNPTKIVHKPTKVAKIPEILKDYYRE